MRISISNLSEGVHEYHFTSEPALLGLGDNFTQDVTVDVALDKSGREILLNVEACAPGTFICDRCVDSFVRRIETAYKIVYMYDERESARYPDDEVQVIHPGTSTIELDDDLRQFLLLAVPAKLLCRDTCKGLCPNCGTNWNRAQCTCRAEKTDHRWQKLKERFSH